MADVYLAHYKKQLGGGFDDISHFYINTRGMQTGRGIGGFFRNIFKYIKPLFSAGLKFLKSDGLQTGADMLQDLASKKSMKDILKNRGGDALLKFSEIAKKTYQDGSGLLKIRKSGIKKKKKYIKPGKGAVKRHSNSGRGTKQSKKKKVSTFKDIFS